MSLFSIVSIIAWFQMGMTKVLKADFMKKSHRGEGRVFMPQAASAGLTININALNSEHLYMNMTGTQAFVISCGPGEAG